MNTGPAVAPADKSPDVRLRPKANARALRQGFPWIYANELVTDRRTKALPPGSLVRLVDDARHPLGRVAVSPQSKIIARMIDRDPDAVIDAAWFRRRIARAEDLRKSLYQDPFYRLVNAEADGLPGIVVDRFGDTLILQPNAAWAENLLAPLVDALTEVTGAKNILKNAGGRSRALEGLDDIDTVLTGCAPEAPVPVPMNGAFYMADLVTGQKTGLFFDQRPNHAFAAGLAPRARVLDVFSHVGGFSLACLAAGAESALAVDASAAALSLAEAGAAVMDVSDRFVTRKGEAFDVMTALADEQACFDLVICDPPAFAPSRTSLDAGLRAYERVARLAARLVAPEGYLSLCSCSHAADLGRFRQACVRGIGRAGRAPTLIHTGFAGPDHPQMPQLTETGYLKALFFRL
ncbi:MAG: class I SAM-dependent rRNA methyltransferase [Pseudomonadota bacterium]